MSFTVRVTLRPFSKSSSAIFAALKQAKKDGVLADLLEPPPTHLRTGLDHEYRILTAFLPDVAEFQTASQRAQVVHQIIAKALLSAGVATPKFLFGSHWPLVGYRAEVQTSYVDGGGCTWYTKEDNTKGKGGRR